MPNDETNPEIFSCSAHVLNGPKPVELSRCVVFGCFLGSCQIGSPFFRRHVLDVWNIFEGNLGSPKIKPIGTPFRLPTLQRSLPHGLPNKPPSHEMLGNSDWLTYRNTDRRYPVPSVFLRKKGILSISTGAGFLLTTVYQGGIIILQLAGACYSTVFGKDNLFICRKKALVTSDSPQDQKHHPCKHNSTCREAPFLRAKILGDAKKTNLLGPWSTWSSLPLQGTQAPHHLTMFHQSRPQVCGSEASGKRGRSERSAFSYASLCIWCAWYIQNGWWVLDLSNWELQ